MFGAARESRIRDVVEWRVQPSPLALRAARGVGTLVAASLAVMSGTTVDVSREPRLQQDPDEDLDLEPVFVEGQAPWMPPAWTGKQLVTMSQRRATIDPKGPRVNPQ